MKNDETNMVCVDPEEQILLASNSGGKDSVLILHYSITDGWFFKINGGVEININDVAFFVENNPNMSFNSLGYQPKKENLT